MKHLHQRPFLGSGHIAPLRFLFLQIKAEAAGDDFFSTTSIYYLFQVRA
ncbi:hypothetical protein [Bacillus haynesii]|nr:hypothetical protein [Bacillus haynesii]MCY8555215.1 hypothetical protein [Bacillus haynesii]